VRVRIERLAPDGSFRDGDIVRRQSSNLPPEANDAGLIPLPVSQGGGLGHCVAFRYSPALKVLAIQFDTRAVVNESFAVLLARDRSRGNLPG
jgi:hypothetical protein